MRRYLTTEEFYIRAKKAHAGKVSDDWYDYSRVDYKGAKEKVEIGCKKHGFFWQIAGGHLQGKGCPKCGVESTQRKQSSTTEKFIRRAIEEYGDWFDYSRTVYVTNSTALEIGCPKHGFVWCTPPNHFRHGIGCPKCGIEIRNKIHRHTTETFTELAIKLYGDQFDYSRVDYKGTREKVEIGCKEHGFFWVAANNHLHGNRGNCPTCGYFSRIKARTHSEAEFLVKANAKHDNFYDYSEMDYVNGVTKIKIGCKIHGFFWQTGKGHIAGHGCPKCGQDKSGRKYTDNPTILYYIKLTDLDGTDYWKIGITSLTLEKRFQKSMDHIDVIWTKPYSTGKPAFAMEQKILSTYTLHRAYNKNISVMRGGWTELFTEDVLHFVPVTWGGSVGVMPRTGS